MSIVSSRLFYSAPAAVPPSVASPGSHLAERIAHLYRLAQRSDHVFASPLGPFQRRGESVHLPRFVYFGPHTSEESLRLAFYAGFDQGDPRTSLALINVVERLILAPSLGQGLNLSLFPLVDAQAGATVKTPRHLADLPWAGSGEPELDLLQKDARTRAYHGFVRLETAPGLETLGVSLDGAFSSAPPGGVELISSEDSDPWPVRWESAQPDSGVLSLLADLPLQPFQLTIRVPTGWSTGLHRESVTTLLTRFILRYRGHQAYGQHL